MIVAFPGHIHLQFAYALGAMPLPANDNICCVCSKAVILLVFIHCYLSHFCDVFLGTLSSLAIIFLNKGELTSLIQLCYDCLCSVSLPYGSWVCLQSVVVEIPDHTPLLFINLFLRFLHHNCHVPKKII